MSNKRDIISYADLVKDPELLAKRDKLNELLSHPPREEWLKDHPIVRVKDRTGKQVPHKYLPVDKHKYLMNVIFGGYRQEIRDVSQVANAIRAIVRVHYVDPLTGEWTWQDGTGAVQMQLNQNSAAFDLTNIKANAVQIGAPAAVSYAFKNATENLGRLFGMDLENWDALAFKGMYSNGEKETSNTNTNSNVTDLDVEML